MLISKKKKKKVPFVNEVQLKDCTKSPTVSLLNQTKTNPLELMK